MSDPDVRPFRWDVTRPEQLGRYAAAEVPATYEGFRQDLLECSARVLSLAGDSDLVFVGRSPDALFHLLSGILAGTRWADRLHRLAIAIRGWSFTKEQRRALEPHLDELGLYGEGLLRRTRPAALVDVVATGGTLTDVCGMLQELTVRDGVEWRGAARKLRIVGITRRTKSSPHTVRWQQTTFPAGLVPSRAIKNVSAPGRFASYLAADQPKMSGAYPPWDWGDPAVELPLRDKEARDAIALALSLYEDGLRQSTRVAFGGELVRQPAMRHAWFRTLVQDIKRRPVRASYLR